MLGIFISLYQTQIASGAKFWQEYWEVRLSEIEDKLRHHMGGDEKKEFECLFSSGNHQKKIFGKVEEKTKEKYKGFMSSIPTWFMFKKYSVSRVPIVAGVTLLFFWMGLFVHSVSVDKVSYEVNSTSKKEPASNNLPSITVNTDGGGYKIYLGGHFFSK